MKAVFTVDCDSDHGFCPSDYKRKIWRKYAGSRGTGSSRCYLEYQSMIPCKKVIRMNL